MSEAEDKEAAGDHANVVIMPPLLYAIALAAGIAMQFVASLNTGLPSPLRLVTGALLVGGGAWVALGFARAFDRIEQDRSPNTPTPAIISDGLYQYSRNPAYVSLTGILLGIGLLLDNVWLLLSAIPVVAIMQWGVIAREEAYLERAFGDEYLRYKSSVRRWL
jgi:protein-S-isoprenylcysteine O-methyltransferase Ste14